MNHLIRKVPMDKKLELLIAFLFMTAGIAFLVYTIINTFFK